MHRRWLGLALLGVLAPATGACGRDAGTAGDAAADTASGMSSDASSDVGPADATTETAPAHDAAVDAGPPPEAGSLADGAASVVQFHNHLNRDGTYVDAALTHAAVATMHLDTSFSGATPGHVYAQPLYVESGPAGRGAFYVVTEGNDVYALDERTGEPLWHRNVGTSAGVSGAGCGNVSPIGITGTPVVDVATRTLFFDAAVAAQAGGPIATHYVHALSIDDGVERAGWPFDVSTVRGPDGTAFQPQTQNQRSALLLVGGVVYVAFGGHGGDCGTYHGWVVGLPVSDPSGARAYMTPAAGCGIWSPGGPSSDGTNIYVTTGNATTAVASWQGSEAVVRLGAGPTFGGQANDSYAPADWPTLDQEDLDLSGTGPMVLDAPGLTPSRMLLALGKDGTAHLLERDDGGGLGAKPVLEVGVNHIAIIGAAAWFSAPSGTYFVSRGYYGGTPLCPAGMQGDLATIKIDPASPTGLSAAWCAKNQGEGAPIVTTVDGVHQPIVWTAGAEDSERLHAWDAETGAPLFEGGGPGDQMAGLRHFTTLVVVHGRVFAGADDRLYAFTP